MDKNKKQIIKISVFITSIFVIFLSITYAFINVQLTGTKKQVITAGTLDLELEEENEITITDALPMYDDVGMIQEDVLVFRLINKTANATNYVLKLQEIQTGTLDKSIVKYGLIKEGEPTIDYVSNITDGIIDEGTIVGNDTLDYELRLWIDSKVTETTKIQNKFLSFRMTAEASQKIETLPSFAEQLENKVQESTSTFPNFKEISSATNGRGIYKYQEDGEDIYYWRGAVDEVEGAANHLLFANLCWEMVRTTKTDGIKIIYDGAPVEVDGIKTCPNTGEESQLPTKTTFNSNLGMLASSGYMYGSTEYNYTSLSTTGTTMTTEGILYGYDVEWKLDETTGEYMYELKSKEEDGSLFSSTGVWEDDRIRIADGNHYTCLTTEAKCKTVKYVYYTANAKYVYYIKLDGGNKIEDALNQMYSNDLSSKIKTEIETWFESTDLDEEENLSKLEDVVYCNDRSIQGENIGGWNKDGDSSRSVYYSSYTRMVNGTPDLNCRNTPGNRDRFTYKDTVNGNGLLKWPVALLTADEIMLAGGQNSTNSDYHLYTAANYWSLSPFGLVYGTNSSNFYVSSNGVLDGNYVNYTYGVRPVITLSSDVEITGVGTESNPYIAK